MPRLSQQVSAGHIGAGVCIALAALVLAPRAVQAQIASSTKQDGRTIFVNAEPPTLLKVAHTNSKSRATIYLPSESPFSRDGYRPAMSIDRDGTEKIVREAAERHHVDPALVRAVIETESGWNPRAVSRKGAGGLMQLIPTTAQRYGAYDLFNPQQNIDAGVRHLKTLLERYNGNLDLALAAYNAGAGAVDRAHGVPAYRETQDYVRKVQAAYFSPNSGRLPDAFINPHAIRREADANGRIIFTNQ